MVAPRVITNNPAHPTALNQDHIGNAEQIGRAAMPSHTPIITKINKRCQEGRPVDSGLASPMPSRLLWKLITKRQASLTTKLTTTRTKSGTLPRVAT